MTSPSAPQTDVDTALRIALSREMAMREILHIISGSRDDVKPVFDAILRNAARLCDAPLAFLSMTNDARTHVTVPAHLGARPDFAAALTAFHEPLEGSELVAVRAISEGRVFRSDDVINDPQYHTEARWRSEFTKTEGGRSILVVPLMRGDEGIGAIILYRREIKPFSDDDVDLVETFATQAVIAIDNARLLSELQTRQRELADSLKHQTASSEILQLIASSQADVEPVLRTVAETACRICDAYDAVITLRDADWLRLAAHFGSIPFDVDGIPLNGKHSTSRAVREGRPVHVDDILTVVDEYPDAARLAERTGWRAVLAVPLMKDGRAIGAIGMRRIEARAFTQQQIERAQAFANQAVIAIENARLFSDLQSRTDELRELNAELESRVETQVGELERLGRLRRFLSPQVADAVVSSGDEKLLGSHRAMIAVLFCDIRGFTAFCEMAEPEETIEVLQTYHEEMGKLINSHGAGVDHRLGDGIMVIFNDPLPCDDPASDALRLALAMRERMTALCEGWRRLGHKLGFGVGISLGYATVGTVGSEGRYDYTASGTAVNLAARLCDEAEDGDILLSPRAFAAVEDRYAADSIGERNLKGIHSPVEVYRITSAKSGSLHS